MAPGSGFLDLGDGAAGRLGGDAKDVELAGLGGDELDVRVERIEIDAIQLEQIRCGDIHEALVPPTVVDPFTQCDGWGPELGIRLDVRIDGHVDGRDRGVVERRHEPVDLGLRAVELGRLGDEWPVELGITRP